MQVHSSTSVSASPLLDDPVLAHLTEVSHRSGLDDVAARLMGVQSWINRDMATLNGAIGQMCGPGHDHLADRAASYLLQQPGKRIRPLCVALAARIGGRKLDDVVCNLAVAAELVHAATLLHDDVIDEGTERRGAAAARVVFGNSASVLGGDHLLVKALKLVRLAHADSLGQMLDTLEQMVAAEAAQLARRGSFVASREAYLEVVSGKTASLFAWALAAGGQVAGLDSNSVAALRKAGRNLGTAFQLVDDVLDFSQNSEVIGKNTLADLRDGKVTWPLILVAEKSEEVRAVLNELAEQAAQGASQVPATRFDLLLSRIRESGALDRTREFALLHTAHAQGDIARLPSNGARQALMAVVEAVGDRVR